jgi:repressor LexA
VRRNPEAVNGQIVVARLDGVTIKRFERTGDRFACCRATRRISRSSYSPVRIAIEGVFCGLVAG